MVAVLGMSKGTLTPEKKTSAASVDGFCANVPRSPVLTCVLMGRAYTAFLNVRESKAAAKL